MRTRRNIKLAIPIIITLSLLIIVDFSIGDDNLFIFINQEMSNSVFDFICSYMSLILFAVSSIFSLIFLFGSKNKSNITLAIMSIITAVLAYGTGSILKTIFQVPRPFEVLPARVIGFLHTSSFSFPSTTTMLAFGFAFPILFEKPKLGCLNVVSAFLIGFSVIYTGYHYPKDVIAGTFFSMIISLIMNAIQPKLLNFLEERKIIARLTKLF